jgi:putative ABC transport system substrate-binding protein
MLVDPANVITETTLRDVQEAARSLGLQIQIFNASTFGELDAVFAALARERPDALFVDSSFGGRQARLLTLTASHRIPASYPLRDDVADGGLMSYDADLSETVRLASVYIARILSGAKPADLPVVRSTKFRFVINLKTAKALGLTVPRRLLALADEVIE